MPRITRKQQKIFAENASNNGVFGSLQSNDPVTSSDPATIQGRTAFSNGWNDATYSAEQLPPLEEFQAIQYVVTRQLAYILQEGIPEWDTNTTYYKGSIVKVVSNATYTLFESLIDNNTGNLTSDTTKWKVCGVSEDFNTGIHYWRADVTYGLGDWVRGVDANGNPDIFQSLLANNKGNAVTNNTYWNPLGVGRSGFPLLTCLPFEHELNEASWLRADTWSWHDGTVYEAAYDLIEDQFTNGTQKSFNISYFNSYGSLTNTNGVVSGFSSSNYIETPSDFSPSTEPWVIVTKVKTNASMSTGQIVFHPINGDSGNLNIGLWIKTDSHLELVVSSNGTTWAIQNSGSATLSASTDYWLRTTFTGSAYTVEISTDGTNWTTDISVSSSTSVIGGKRIRFGSFPDGRPINQVNMNETKILIDGDVSWVGNINVPYTEGTNGMKIVASANAGNVQDLYEKEGVAWYYVLDTANTQFKLPRTKYGFTGLRDTVGKYVPESLPNIKGYSGLMEGDKSSVATVISKDLFGNNVANSNARFSEAADGSRELVWGNFNASGVVSTYQDNAPVQERATQMYLYFYVGNTIRNQTEIDVGEITEALTKKWDSSNMQVVSALPENPQTGVFYFVK